MELTFCVQIETHCKYSLSSSYGLRQFTGEIKPDELICINITIFDYYIIFNQTPRDVIIDEYRSLLSGADLYHYATLNLEQIGIYAHTPGPFASQTISSKIGGVMSFSFGSLPGICKTGIIFTNNQHIENLFFSGTQEGPYHIGVNDDLCIVSTIRTNQIFSLDIQTEKCCDKIFIYHSMIPVNAYSGPVDETFEINATDEPAVFRFVSDDKAEESKYIKIAMGSDGDYPFESGIVFFDPLANKTVCPPMEECTFFKFFNVIIVVIVISVIIGIIILFSFIFYYTARCCCPRFVKYDPKIYGAKSGEHNSIIGFNNVPTEMRGEPAGYFALDPILRPKE